MRPKTRPARSRKPRKMDRVNANKRMLKSCRGVLTAYERNPDR
jgi:hypothetical protein